MNIPLKLIIPCTDKNFEDTSFEVNFLRNDWIQIIIDGKEYNVDSDWIHRLSNMIKPLTYEENDNGWGKICKKYY